MKLLMAIVVTAAMLATATAGYQLIGSNARVVQKYDRARQLNLVKFKIRQTVACRASYKAICRDRKAVLVYKGRTPDMGKVAFMREGKGLLPVTPEILVLRSHCDRKGLSFDWLVAKNGEAAMDPVSRRESEWRPLFETPLCGRGGYSALGRE